MTLPTSFDAPERLLLLLAVGALAVAYGVVQARRRSARRAWTSDALLPSAASGRPAPWRHVGAALLALSLVTMTVAFAEPRAEKEVERERATVVVALDTSTSMFAKDVAPYRFAAARAAATAFVEDLPAGFEVGLVTFDHTATVQVAPTQDHSRVVSALQSLVLAGGTALGDALHSSLDALAAADAGPAGAVVLLADGGSTSGGLLAPAVQRAVEAEVPVSTIAYGTADGVVVSDGRSIPVPVDEQVLADIANATGGRAYTAASAGELDAVYEGIRARLTSEVKRVDVSSGLVGVALLLLAAGAVPALLRR